MFVSGGINRSYPFSFGINASVSVGILDQCDVPTGDKVDAHLHGFGMAGATGYYGLGVSQNWSPGTGMSTQIGIGLGVGVSPGEISEMSGSWGRVEIKNKWLRMLVVAIFLVGLLKILADVRGGDWDGRPSLSEIAKSNEALSLPPEAIAEASSVFSKVTFMAAVVEGKSALTVDEAANHYVGLARALKWSLKVDRLRASNRVLVFCSGRLSRAIEIMPIENGVRIYSGTYWDTEERSEKYCKAPPSG